MHGTCLRRRNSPVGDGVLDVPLLRFLPTLPRSACPRPASDDLAVYHVAHVPSPTRRRGRRPRRPFPSSTASPTGSRGLRAAEPPAKGEPPARVPPLTPSCASLSMGEFRALRRAAMGSAPGPRPLFCKKAGQKTFTWRDFCQPKPLALGASDSIRPRSGHLSGRVAPPTRVGEAGGSRNLTGAPPPKSVFLWGSTPFLWARPKKWGGTGSANVKTTNSKTASSAQPKPNPRARVEPRPYRRAMGK